MPRGAKPKPETERALRLLTKERLQRLAKTKSQSQIAKKYKVRPSVVRKLQRKYKLPTITEYSKRSDHRCKYRRIDLNQFSEIDNESLAYVLGYLAWAGSVINDKGYYNITAGPKSLDTLQKVHSKLGLDQPIREVKNGQYTNYMIFISQKGLGQVLRKWYYKGSRFDFKKFPPKMPRKFLPHYLRGYFERHGYISPSCVFIRMTLPSKRTANQLKKCLKKLAIESKVMTTKYDYQKDVHRVEVQSSHIPTFFEKIYQGDWTVGTQRKNKLMIAAEHNLRRKLKLKGNNDSFDSILQNIKFKKVYKVDLTP